MSPKPLKRKPPEKPVDNKKAIKNILTLLKDHKAKLIITIVCAIISTAFTIIAPLLIGKSTTIIYEGTTKIINHTGTIDLNSLMNLLIIVVVLYVVSALFSYLQSYFIIELSTKISFDLRQRIMDKILYLPMEKIGENKRGDILSRMTNDIDSLQHGISQSFVQLTTAVITLVGVFIMMLSINVIMALATIVLVPIAFLVIKFITKHSQSYFLKQLEFKGSLNGQIEETFTGHDIIRAFNQEEISMEKFEKDNNSWFNNEWKSQFFSSLNGPLMNFISNFTYVVIAVLGAVFVLQKAIAVGDILAFFQYSQSFTRPIQQITRVMNQIQTAMAASERIFEFLDLDDEENPSTRKLDTINDNITFEDVSFGYSPNEKIIKNLTFEVKKGQKIAIIGETGAGKTTIVKLLMRFYDIDSGSIKIDGVDIDEYDKHSLRSHVGMVLQDSWLFSDTIKSNIRYGNLEVSDDEIVDASKQVYIDNFIRQLPDGYETTLNEDSDNISHGQKQLLTIARTILSSKEILILDEATSSVDTRTEKLIQKAIDKLMENKTSFIIAHRLSTIRNADKIIVIENGEIIEQGTHEELLDLKGYYYNTLNSQSRE
ncbi:MAG: ABC transporter ATP-binding protein [Methanobrevibacter sp.]|uniref:ABC transporter ATP-binding protein n=1 Tax=Methanobrevibacter TaxID=2172 RepID=UPI0026F089F1|nr:MULTISPECIES: ABC transporter ATP-binding protein [Methanobrevibacter]MBS7257942.1 ABC transporter ATP-binding protein [Methanobrevibacter sp.]MDY3096553.1 ABC transporter ATP-binding protein [Methanobrevibacter sp.]